VPRPGLAFFARQGGVFDFLIVQTGVGATASFDAWGFWPRQPSAFQNPVNSKTVNKKSYVIVFRPDISLLTMSALPHPNCYTKYREQN
jgi:hypothetical protein